MNRFLTLLLGVAMVAMVGAVHAQTNSRIRANVVSFANTVLVVKTAVGKEISLQLNDKTTISYARLIKFSDIKDGDFVGSAAMPGPDGKLVAREVHLFPPERRGTGEGHRPMDEPGTTMTNATVAKIVKGSRGQELTMQYKGGEKIIIVQEGTPIVVNEVGDRSLLVPGSSVVIAAQTAQDGTVTALRIQATSKAGVKPVT